MGYYLAIKKTSSPRTTIKSCNCIGICIQVCHFEESKKEDDKGLVMFPEAFRKEKSWTMFEKVLKNYLGTKKRDQWDSARIHNVQQ